TLALGALGAASATGLFRAARLVPAVLRAGKDDPAAWTERITRMGFGNPGEAALLADMGAQVMHTNIVWPYFPLRRDKGGLPQKDADALRKLVRTCHDKRSEERRVGKEHRARWAPYARIEIIALPAEG